MKTLKLALLISVLVINSSAYATGGKKMPPKEATLMEQIIEIFTISQK